ncbi:hypothetical protein [Streptomyces sp. CC208A]|uniref:hypothetical protein n=1 Tax=Streptomyces sp. CC208A TaxID=3044573 RepID=UPI0024A83478|nr:hypothetical protein [Streptomyces sp. CC208A]
MTAAQDYEHLHHLVDRLSPSQVRRLRLIITEDEELSRVDRQVPDETEGDDGEGELLPASFLALSGSIEAPADYAERHDDYIRERAERERSTGE